MRAAQRDSGQAITTLKGNPDEQSDMQIARQVTHALNRHYPGHPWVISVQGGGLVLRHQMISLVAGAHLRREGFSYLMPRSKMGTAKQIEHSAVMAGGAMLELFRLPRSGDKGLLPQIPEDWKAKQTKGFA